MSSASPGPTNGRREAWHYDAMAGRPEWSKQLAREAVIRRQREKLESRKSGVPGNGVR